jgi:pimeloyl-ACP methyl ester carboxylesterase
MKYTLFKKHKISYSKYGSSGKTIVLLHGFCENQKMWHDIALNLKEYVSVITVDLPGFGSSDFIPEAGLEVYAEAVRAVLLEEKINQCAIVGHSMGGYVALAFTEMYPGMIHGLGLFHSHPFEDDEIKKMNRNKAIELVKQYGSERYVKELFSGLFTNHFKTHHAQIVESFVKEFSQTLSETVLQALIAMRNRKGREESLKNFKGKCLFIIGREDSTLSLDKSIEMVLMANTSIVHLFDRCGHMGMIEYPEKSIEALKQFSMEI